jgi:superfamily II DNA or RNA helicase
MASTGFHKDQGRARLSKRLSGDFTATIRDRGQSYFSQGRVKILYGTDTELEAQVEGSANYAVNFEWKEDTLFATCGCPYFEGGESCKHLWAAILAADARGYLSVPASAPDLYMECDYFGVEEDEEDESVEDVFPPPRSPAAPQFPAVKSPPPPKPPSWQVQIAGISELHNPAWVPRFNWPASRQILYAVNVSRSERARALVISPMSRDALHDGTWKTPVSLNLKREHIAKLPSADDREILSALAGAIPYLEWGYSGISDRIPEDCLVPHPLAEKIIPIAARAGRFHSYLHSRTDGLTPLAWDEGEPWRFVMELSSHPKSGWEISGVLRRGDERIKLQEAALITPGGLVFTRGHVAPFAADTPFGSVLQLKTAGPIRAPEKALDALLGTLLTLPGLPEIEVPEEVRIEEVKPAPQIRLRIHAQQDNGYQANKLWADLAFEYEGRQVADHNPLRGFYQAEGRRFVRRDAQAEEAAVRLLSELGGKCQKPTYYDAEPKWSITPSKLPRIVRGLVEAGWHIEAEGKVFRRPGAFRIEVSSGIDWFELHGSVEYGESTARLPQLLEALRRGDTMVQLDDGTYGVLPEQWLKRIGLLAGLGTPEDEHIRFRPSQAGLLDVLLASQPESRCDETFARAREELGQFQGINAAPQPEGFVGHLRDYQREGLGWMQFLRRFSFGGCLADDMGVGKTAQVLALLETRRASRTEGNRVGPSLVVVPRSLIFNWKQEAERFTPQLRVLDYTGAARDSFTLADYDVILTTYGTLRREVVRLKDVEFDYVILDEAQAIKNAATEAAKAVRLLRGAQRLALSGTPVENHLGELWSLFEFLNPGMLGRASVFKFTSGAARNPEEETRRLLAHALRPFILRRTKAQVAPELPAKTEQTVYCEMESAQRKLYNELRQHYRDTLLKRVEDEGLAKSKIQVLEALLRLRQAACHPGLIDKQRFGESSAKLDTLMEQLREVLDEGHKALVFSQFTSLLAIVRSRLDAEGIVYEYLDGATRDRQARVERFQNSPDCPLFLVSLKAGGLGLNLTAAEYVFLLDPWWNPAVEAQAIDRAHRIGQTRQVFAYRLIARDTVEEKVLELQKTKRDLAAAIISEDNNLIRDLRREDLELLLS